MSYRLHIFQCLLTFIISIHHVYSLIDYIEAKYPLKGKPSAPNAPWPQPQYLNASSDYVYIDPNFFVIHSNLKDCDVIDNALQRYKSIFFPPKISIQNPDRLDESRILLSVFILIQSKQCHTYPQLRDDQSYNLTIESSYGIIYAENVWGALNGIETFSQLLFITGDNYLATNASVYIQDWPRFPYRGILLDTARHFLPVPIIKQHLDAMASNKFNVLHWHITDDQSWPFVSETFPQLTEKGAFSSAHVYTAENVQDIIEHARLRGIRTIPEFDTPGHVAALGRAFPEFLTDCYNGSIPCQAIYGVHAEREILDPTKAEVYNFMNEFLKEVKGVFKYEPYIHLGMDEVYPACWLSNPSIENFLNENNMSNGTDLMSYYSSRILKLMQSIGGKSMVWQDVWDDGVKLPSDTVIEIWKDTSLLSDSPSWSYYLSKATSEGYDAVLAAPFYLNMIEYGKYNTPESVMNLEFFKWYNIDLFANFTGDDEARQRLIGGEAALWAEFVDGTNSLSRLWPRASAIAERLWSSIDVNNPEDAQFRLDVHRCRMLRRGIPAAPLLNGYCGLYEVGMKQSMVNEPIFNYIH
ncbi:unnamed protein product [Rotaria socialis]|uniref:Beta-hexosaminidase n=1 Tax=Rotaria socialis TaxID=392032 RepID=A0A821CBV4_9BILA|nr:unnamed protein product [Rotaria socialis]CAF3330089.1 unnamed protein product [Rotaria socialis]CAF3423545.1 unnamed protein product [Rotaria socialis]CAF3580549.1 unnamed protein product [Rotaria socialis]CAF4134866.1 unnamed protein product [Rotaria socialis]